MTIVYADFVVYEDDIVALDIETYSALSKSVPDGTIVLTLTFKEDNPYYFRTATLYHFDSFDEDSLGIVDPFKEVYEESVGILTYMFRKLHHGKYFVIMKDENDNNLFSYTVAVDKMFDDDFIFKLFKMDALVNK